MCGRRGESATAAPLQQKPCERDQRSHDRRDRPQDQNQLRPARLRIPEGATRQMVVLG